MTPVDFQKFLALKGQELFRPMPWRTDTRPYYILVSELMLQQTQVDRVVPKFEAFIDRFSDESSLAAASLAEVLTLWQGLGYNRRAKYLHLAAQSIINDHSGQFPQTVNELLALPGVGQNTAGAISAYAFNNPVIFIETNVRTVYFHHFFDQLDTVSDSQIRPLLEQTINRQNPRQFYWALMDYGSHLKRQGIKNVGQSTHYKKQSALDGSVRQIRGLIVKALAQQALSISQLEQSVPYDERFDPALSSLVKDGMVEFKNSLVQLTS